MITLWFVMMNLFPVLGQIGGSVFWDENNNGIRDAHEKGAGGAIVSDGLHVVKTSEDGVFELPGWEKDLNYRRLPGFVSGLVTDGNMIYTGFGETLTALNAGNGKVLWKSEEKRGGEGSTPTMTLADSVLITSRHWGGIDAFNRFTGEYLWTRSDQGLRFRNGVLVFKEGKLWVAEYEDAKSGRLHEMDLNTGKTIGGFSTFMQNTGTAAPIILEDQVIIAGSHPGVASFDRKTGIKQWEFEVGPALFYSPPYYSDQQQSLESSPVLIGDHLVFGAMDGTLQVISLSSGKLLWKTKLGAPVLTTAAVTEVGFFICDFGGNIYYYKSAE